MGRAQYVTFITQAQVMYMAISVVIVSFTLCVFRFLMVLTFFFSVVEFVFVHKYNTNIFVFENSVFKSVFKQE